MSAASGGSRAQKDAVEADAHAEDTHAELARSTIAAWQPLSSRLLSQEDARQIVENLSGFFTLLADLDAEDRSAEPIRAA